MAALFAIPETRPCPGSGPGWKGDKVDVSMADVDVLLTEIGRRELTSDNGEERGRLEPVPSHPVGERSSSAFTLRAAAAFQHHALDFRLR